MMYQWREFYPEAIGSFPHSIPEPLGNNVQMMCYVDANHAANILNMQSHYGILIYVNITPMIWYFKSHNKVELSYFCSKFVALRNTTELVLL